MSVEVMELFSIFSKTFSKEDAQLAVKDIEALISDHKRELATKEDLRETELKLIKEIEINRGEIKEVELKLTREIEKVRLDLTKEIEAVKLEVEKARSSTIKWLVGWMVALVIAQTGAIITMFMLFNK